MFSFLLPQKWSSQAVVTLPESSQLIELRRATVQLTVLDVPTNIDAEHTYQNFLKDFDSQALREEYLTNSDYVKQLVDAKNAGNKAILHRAIQETAAKFKAVNNADPKISNATSYSSWTLSFTGPNAEESREVLSGYIDFITQRVNQDTVQNLRYAVELKSAVGERQAAAG
ncbi:Ferric enterobactin transport protein fepE [Cedecea neteri]|uniref:Ferric enterobactin transport protein fepE n=1 Tax=Cedecea neteri TaxID=158822 RepID=A0A2X2T5Q9_9ENTR|nr:Ferric enterobactin transport protein fepE [Cedecea neteri]